MTETSLLSSEAWTELASGLNGYVRRRVDPASADDVVGSVLLNLVRHQAALRKAENPLAWVRRAAANAIADHYRRRAAERRALDAFEAESEQTSPEDTEADSTAEFARCLQPFIDGLPAPYGEALILTDIEGLTQAEAATRLGLSHSGMKSRVQRGRAKLKEALLRCCTIETDRRGGVIDYERRANKTDCTGSC